MNFMYAFFSQPTFLACTLSLFFVLSCTLTLATPKNLPRKPALPGLNGSPAAMPADSTQLITVTAKDWRSQSVKVHTLEKKNNQWIPVFPPMEGVIGRNGFAEPNSKREGDGKTPSGIYPLEMSFGYAAKIDTKMPYKQTAENDVWVDDVNSPDYNKWVKIGKTDAASHETLKRRDHLYRYVLVIGYNTDPVIKGKGSAIFLHLWKERSIPTAGCVAMAEEDVVRILSWLDPAKKPMILMGKENFLTGV